MQNDHISHKHHAHHAHDHKPRDQNLLLWPLVLISGFAVIEAIGGWITGSLALLGDAGHMFSDAAALALAWVGAWVARKPASARHSFGLMRAEVIVALLNGLFMLAVVAAIIYEAIERLQSPQPVAAGGVMLIAFVGLVINVVVAVHLHRGQHTINHRAALLHVIGDLLGSLAALAAGVVIYFTGWFAIDPILSLFISILILLSTLKLLREVLHMLMEGVPHHLDIAEVSEQLIRVPAVEGVHHVRIWSLSSEEVALSAHVVLKEHHAWPQTLAELRRLLHRQFNIRHVTLQPEFSGSGSIDPQGCWLTEPHNET
ncbi:Cadmium, cobalt and zinc/H(+)-K(+) antiporter [Methylophilaceae bacterium]|nr:Cadmium, cobalt and zinc/H(+)-K(+) antiporter [Methylophilaceae bacterium]